MAQLPNEITIPIAEAISETLDRPATDLPPLADAINLTGLDAVASGNPPHDVTVTFPYAGLHVLVRSNRTVCVYPLQRTWLIN